MTGTVVIDCLSGRGSAYHAGYAVVAIDVIRATTTATTAVSLGHRCFPVPSLEAANALARELDHPVLAGELGGIMPTGFDMNNSPVELQLCKDRKRPVILLSTSGTQLLHESRDADAVHLACFRNAASVSEYLSGRHQQIAILGAETRGDFREEDQICAAWIARDLVERDYRPANSNTARIIERWGGAAAHDCLVSRSVIYLKESGQLRDLEFILSHVNDLEDAFVFRGGEIVQVSTVEPARVLYARA